MLNDLHYVKYCKFEYCKSKYENFNFTKISILCRYKYARFIVIAVF